MLGFRARRFGAVIVTIVVVASACGGGGDDDASDDIVLRTQGDIAVEEGEVAETTTTTVAADPERDEGEPTETDDPTDATTTSTTLPQEEEGVGDALFAAVAEFQSCLDATGFEFIGLPDGGDPDEPQNSPAYLEALVDCAARSQIQERLADVDAAQADLTPDEVEDQNRQYVAFRDCMVGRGWDIPEPVPNEFGLLFPGFAAAASWQGPPGEDITSTDDVGECTDAAGVDLDTGS